jgi:hypothetical protein
MTQDEKDAEAMEIMVVPKEWSDGKILTVRQWGRREYDFGKQVGFNDGIKMAKLNLMDLAVEQFKQGNDEKAAWIRSIATKIFLSPIL